MPARDERPDTVRECCARWDGWRALNIPTLWEIEVLDYIEHLEAELDEWRGAFEPVLVATGERLRLKVTRPPTVIVGPDYEPIEED